MTHILIPIKDIEEELKILQLNRQNKINKGFLSDAQNIQAQILVYKEILLGKQISLNKEDIEAKADKWATVEFYKNTPEFYPAKESYKQALKDLI